ncbi:MAG: F0F1 ATP synthase subunit A [Candidatus Sericytochromatia bacterium]|nr:F0F1 ATP synthase subunit A [Candidatus Sericytochromatia bacterium]
MINVGNSVVEHASSAAEHAEGLGVVPEHYKYALGNYTIHLDTVVATWIVMAIVLVLVFVVAGSLKQQPDGKQTVAEALIEFVEGLIKGQMGENKDSLLYIPLIGSIFLFVLFGNWVGLLPWRLLHLGHFPLEIASPTNDLNTTAALALVSVISYFYYGIKKKGLGYFKHYFTPHPAFFFFNFLEDFTRPLSLAFRLFGNIIGGEILLAILLFLVPWFIPLPIFAFEVFVGFIQAFVFAVLTASYIGAAVAEHHHEHEPTELQHVTAT